MGVQKNISINKDDIMNSDGIDEIISVITDLENILREIGTIRVQIDTFSDEQGELISGKIIFTDAQFRIIDNIPNSAQKDALLMLMISMSINMFASESD